MKRIGGIRLKLGVFTSLTALIVMAFSGLVIDRLIGDRIFLNARNEAAALLESLSLSVAMAKATNSVERLDDDLAELVKVGRGRVPIVEVAFFDHKGRRVAYSVRTLVGSPTAYGFRSINNGFVSRSVEASRPQWERGVGEDDRSTLQVSMPAVSGLRWGTLIAAFDLTQVLAEIRFARWLLIMVACGLTVALTVVLYLVLSSMVIKPIRVLAGTVESVQQGFLGARANVRSGDELGQLAQGFNAMAEELQGYTERLERRVEERSREIREKNRLLEDVNTQLEQAVQELDKLAKTDPLTGVFNRRHVSDVLDFEIRRGARTENRLMVALADVDHFKRINDTYGHAVGDIVLRSLANLLRSKLRSTDIVGRYGGEEFLFLLLDTQLEAGIQVAEKVRKLVQSTRFHDPAGNYIGEVTLSIGLARFPLDGEDGSQLVASADRALYAAKHRGRNQVVVYGPELKDDSSS